MNDLRPIRRTGGRGCHFKSHMLAGLALSTLAFTGCAGMTTGSNGTSSTLTDPTSYNASTTGGSNTRSTTSGLSQVKTWSIRTARFLGKAPTIDELAADTSDLMIVAPEEIESKDHPLDKQVSVIRGKGPRHTLLALVDAGYLTPTSPMWDSSWVNASGKLGATAPAWLQTPDKAGSTRYPVQFWSTEWRAKLTVEIDRLRKAGFDGVCIDGLGSANDANQTHTTSYVDMANLIQNEAKNQRTHASSFYVVPLDNDGLVDKLNDAQRLDYLKTVDANVASNVFYHNDKDDNFGSPSSGAAGKTDAAHTADFDLNPQPEMITALDRYQYDHLPVLVVDKVTSADKVSDFQERAKARGYLPWTVPAPASATPPTAPAKSS